MKIRHEISCKRGPIYRTGWSSNGKVLASGHFSGSVMFWDAASGDLISEHREHNDMAVRCLSWSPYDFRIASGDTDGDIIIWDYSEEEVIVRIPNAHKSRVRSVAWSPDGTKLVSGSSDGYVRTWNTKTGKKLSETKNLFPDGAKDGRPTIYSVKWSPDGKLLASCRGSFPVIWDSENYKELKKLEGHNDRVRSVSWSTQGTLFGSCSNDKTIRIWESSSWEQTHLLQIDDNNIPRDTSIFCIHFSPDGKFIATKSTDNSVRLWRLSDTRCVVKLEELCGSGYEENLGGLSFHPFQPIFVSLRNNCENLRIWELDYQFLETSKARYDIDQGFKTSISHTADFPKEFEQAGISILTYFGKIVKDKYPNKEVTVQIKQGSENVTMIIEMDETDRDTVENTLRDYGDVISSKMSVEDFLSDTKQVLELKSQLNFAKAQYETQIEINRQLGAVYQNQFDTLKQLLSEAIQRSPNQNILLDIRQNVNQTLNSNINIAINYLDQIENQLAGKSDIANEISAIKEELSALKLDKPNTTNPTKFNVSSI